VPVDSEYYEGTKPSRNPLCGLTAKLFNVPISIIVEDERFACPRPRPRPDRVNRWETLRSVALLE
jgi:hypothetical protein